MTTPVTPWQFALPSASASRSGDVQTSVIQNVDGIFGRSIDDSPWLQFAGQLAGFDRRVLGIQTDLTLTGLLAVGAAALVIVWLINRIT